MTWTTTTLSDRTDWLPERLLAGDVATWPQRDGQELFLIRDVAQIQVQPNSRVPEGAAYVTPSAIDPWTGALQLRGARRTGLAWRCAPGGLEVGDVLVGAAATSPAVLIGPQHEGLAFSPMFSVLRPIDLPAEVLWALMSSQSGLAVRTEASTSQGSARHITEIRIPTLGNGRAAEVMREVNNLAPSAVDTRVLAPESWWAFHSLLERANWMFLLSDPDPVDLSVGPSLGEVADVRTGRRVSETFDRATPGAVPVLTHNDLIRTKPTRLWTRPADTDAQVHDIVVSTTSHLADAVVLGQRTAVGEHIAIVRAGEPTNMPRLLAALNGRQGKAARRALAMSITIPNLTLKNLRSLPAPRLDETSTMPDTQESLATRLEHLLWD